MLAHVAVWLWRGEDTSKLEKRTHTIYAKVYDFLKPILVSGRGFTYNQKHGNHHSTTTASPKCCYHCCYVLSWFDTSASITEFLSRCDSATFVAAVTRPLFACNYHFLWHPLTVRGQTQEAHKVYKGSGEIELTAKLTGGVVKGECVMVVVEAFPWKKQNKKESLVLC